MEPVAIGGNAEDHYPFGVRCDGCGHILMEHKGVRFPVPFNITFKCPTCGRDVEWISVSVSI